MKISWVLFKFTDYLFNAFWIDGMPRGFVPYLRATLSYTEIKEHITTRNKVYLSNMNQLLRLMVCVKERMNECE